MKNNVKILGVLETVIKFFNFKYIKAISNNLLHLNAKRAVVLVCFGSYMEII